MPALVVFRLGIGSPTSLRCIKKTYHSVHFTGTVPKFVPTSWRHYEQSAFRLYLCVPDELALQSNAIKVQKDTITTLIWSH